MTEFKIDIFATQDNDETSVTVCLRCLDESCSHVIEELKREFLEEEYKENLCLVKVKLVIKDEEVYSNDMSKRFISRATLMDFYNNVTKNGRGLSHLSAKLKNGGKALFCMLIKKCLSSGMLDRDDIIILEASGDYRDKNMVGLVRYYQNMGFYVLNEKTLESDIRAMSVYMYGRVRDVEASCNNCVVSREMQGIIDEVE